LDKSISVINSAIYPVLTRSTLILLAVGGGLYTLGVVFHLSKRLAYQNAIWHGFVLAAASCHYAAVLRAVVYA